MVGLVLLSIILVLLILIYRKVTQNFNYWKLKGVPHENPVPFFGNFFKVATLRESLGKFYTDKYLNHLDKNYLGLYEMKTPVFMPIDIKLIEKILVKDFNYFVNRNFGQGAINSEVGMMLPTLKDGEWRGVRYKLTPAFSSGKLKNMFPIMKNCSNTLLEYLESVRHSDVDMKEASTQFSLDVISNCAFGMDVSKDKNASSEFRSMGKKIFYLNTIAYICYLIVLSVPDWAAKLGLSLVPGEVGKYFAKIFKDAFALRKQSKMTRNDFVDLLLQLKEKGSIDVKMKDPEDSYLDMDYAPSFESFEITDQILVSQAFSFLTGGFDGLSAPMVFIVYELARNPKVQEKLRREIIDKSKDGLTYDALKKMTYLEHCVLEGLRMYPLNPFLLRNCTRDYRLEDGVVIEEGTKIVVPVDGIHYNPQYYPNPKQFNPDRFDENKFSHHTSDFTYLPFGAGPRMCIAMRFSLVTLKLGVATFIKDYHVSLSSQSQRDIEFKIQTFFVKAAKETIYLKFNKLTNVPLK